MGRNDKMTKGSGGMSGDFEVLQRFLQMNINHTRDLFALFGSLPGAAEGQGEKKKEHWLYVPGAREDRCLLVAHADTVWDNSYDRKRFHPEVRFEDGVFFSRGGECGLGADDRAGCAMLWLLRESGHSLLLLDGEEHGLLGARLLMTDGEMAREVNRHAFMLELDRRNAAEYKTYDLPVSVGFTAFIEEKTGFSRVENSAGTDICVLCREICGANLSVGYQNEHTNAEILVYADWQNTLDLVRTMLREPLARFPLNEQRSEP